MTVSPGSPHWLIDFDIASRGIAITQNEDYLYAISDWDYIGKDGVVAKKILSVTEPMSTGSVTVTTEFTLRMK